MRHVDQALVHVTRSFESDAEYGERCCVQLLRNSFGTRREIGHLVFAQDAEERGCRARAFAAGFEKILQRIDQRAEAKSAFALFGRQAEGVLSSTSQMVHTGETGDGGAVRSPKVR